MLYILYFIVHPLSIYVNNTDVVSWLSTTTVIILSIGYVQMSIWSHMIWSNGHHSGLFLSSVASILFYSSLDGSSWNNGQRLISLSFKTTVQILLINIRQYAMSKSHEVIVVAKICTYYWCYTVGVRYSLWWHLDGLATTTPDYSPWIGFEEEWREEQRWCWWCIC